MSEFVPKITGDLSNANPDSPGEDSTAFTPKRQSVEPRSSSEQGTTDTGFKNKHAEELPTFSPGEAKPLKNIQVPAGKADDPVEDSADTTHGPKVNIVRDGDKITQIIVRCKCGETIPLDCVY
tara:strand:+ start:69 stop:437 length:369 start_codon:yes stop_codon:yes gene_type:complete